ncbi:MAG: hypothetical protein WBD40_18150 [Tepidisphaeraceae bacterium]
MKLFVADGSRLEAHEFVPVFHSWIQQHAVPDHLVIDVADYAHVHNGPGTCLIAHEANFYTDRGEGRLGFVYARKQPVNGTFTDRLRQAFVATLEGAKRLETDARLAGRIKFKTDEILLSINDRLTAPSTPETFNAVRDEMQQFFAGAYGADVALRQVGTDETPFKVEVVTKQAPSIDALLARLAGAVAVRA